MFTHNFEPVILEIGFISIRWYPLAYIFGILLGWWLARKIISYKSSELNVSHESFDELVTIIIFSIILGGRFGYVLFYNPFYLKTEPLNLYPYFTIVGDVYYDKFNLNSKIIDFGSQNNSKYKLNNNFRIGNEFNTNNLIIELYNDEELSSFGKHSSSEEEEN